MHTYFIWHLLAAIKKAHYYCKEVEISVISNYYTKINLLPDSRQPGTQHFFLDMDIFNVKKSSLVQFHNTAITNESYLDLTTQNYRVFFSQQTKHYPEENTFNSSELKQKLKVNRNKFYKVLCDKHVANFIIRTRRKSTKRS